MTISPPRRPPPAGAESHTGDGAPPALSRRSLLRAAGTAGATVLVAATGAASYRAWDNGVLDPGDGTAYDPWDRWRSDSGPFGTVAAAILAANPHNTQPWTFHVDTSRPDVVVDVYSDPLRQMPQMDAMGREHQVGIGCALENLLLAAGPRGYRPTVALLPTATDPTHAARVTLLRTTAVGTALYDAIGDRHSDRGPYADREVSSNTLADLAAQLSDLPEVGVRWVTTASERATMTALILDATAAIVADNAQSVEGFAWFRNNRADIDTHRDGLTLDGQGLDAVTLTLAKLLPAGSRTTGDQFWLTQTRTVHTATAAAYGVLTVSDPTDPALRLIGGRALQRLHLAATVRGLSLQHMNQITERIDRDSASGASATFAARFQNLLASPGQEPLVTVRLGHPRRAGRRSPRRSTAAVTR